MGEQVSRDRNARRIEELKMGLFGLAYAWRSDVDRAEFDRWLVGFEREVRAQAWDECYSTAFDGTPVRDPNNPYRKDAGGQA